MANITRFNPLSELSTLDPFSNDFFRGFALRPFLRSFENEPQLRLDVEEDDKAYTVMADIPGVKKEDIKVSIDGNQISISAEVKKEKDTTNGNRVIRSERYYGAISRSFTLDDDVDEGGANAKYDNGVLALTLPKKPGGHAKQISVS